MTLGNHAELAEKFKRDGYLIFEKCVDVSEIDKLKEQASKIVAEFDAESHRSIFTTENQAIKMDTYFIESGDKISFFFEEDAFDENGRLKRSKEQSINKIGHALHDLDPVFSNFSRTPIVQEIVQDILQIKNPKLAQSMYIYKSAYIGGAVSPHQDNWFIHTNPLSCVGVWFALEDATTENGCMWAIPGSHLIDPCQKRFIKQENTVKYEEEKQTKEEGEYVALPVPKGSIIVLHGGLIHKSNKNTSPESRQAYTVHIIDGDCKYVDDNWLLRPDNMPFVGFHNPYVSSK